MNRRPTTIRYRFLPLAWRLRLFVLIAVAAICLLVAPNQHAAALDRPPWRQNLSCEAELQKFRGIEYCTVENGSIHVIVVDLRAAGVRFEYIMPEGFDQTCPVGKENDRQQCKIVECRDVNRFTKHLGGPGCDDPINRNYYPVMPLEEAENLARSRFSNIAAVINSDYGAGDQKEPASRDHGPEGFTVVQGDRLDGKKMGDSDNNAEKRPWLGVSKDAPLHAELLQFGVKELEMPSDDGSKPEWIYTGVGGAPWMIMKGDVRENDMDQCTEASGSCYDGAAQTAVGISQDGRWLFLVADERRGQATLTELAEFMFKWGAWDAIKFDGGGSTHLWYDGKARTSDNVRQLSGYLAVIAAPGHGIVDEDEAIPPPTTTPSLWERIVLRLQKWWRPTWERVVRWWEEQQKDVKKRASGEVDKLKEEAERQLEEKQQEIEKAIQEEAEKQAQNFIDAFFTQCLGSTAMLGFAFALVYHRSRRR